MNTSMIVYRLFDVADEIDLDLVQALWTSRNKIASRLRLDRISTKSITFKDPPVLVELGSHDMKLGNGTYLTEVKARIFDLGVISLILRIHFEDDVTFDEYMDMSIVSENMPEDEIRSYLDAVLETIRPACSNERVSDFDEDFVVYYFQDKVPPSGSLDVPDLLEFANAQFLELRYYDNALNNAIDRTYDELEAAEKGSAGSRQTSYRAIRGRLMELMADVSMLTSNINNALQVTEDIFYARIYTRYLALLRASVWKDNIENKLLVIQRSYNLLNEEVSMYRFEFILALR